MKNAQGDQLAVVYQRLMRTKQTLADALFTV